MGVVVDLVDAIVDRLTVRASPQAQEGKVEGQATLARSDFGRQGKANVAVYRNWADTSELVRGAIDIRRGQVAVAEWDIVPVDPEQDYSKNLKQQIKDLFSDPNPTKLSFRTLIEQVVEDVLVLDAGSVEKVRNLRGEIVQLWPVDGGEIKVAKYWDGDPEVPRYFWYPKGAGRAVAAWLNDDFVYMMARPRTHQVVGLSTMEVLKRTIDAELNGSAYNARQVTSAAPDGMIDLGEGVRPDQVEKFKAYWQSEIAGKGAMAILGGSRGAKFLPFRGAGNSNRDMQFIEWQNYLLRKTALVFQLSPMDLNAVSDVNRATGSVLQENTEDRGFRTLLGLVQEYLTREVVWDEAFGGKANNLGFRFTKLNQRETLDAAKVQQIQTGGIGTRAVNELRKGDGLEPFGPEFDLPMAIVGNQVVVLKDVPTARELLDSSKKPEPVGAGSSPASGKKEN